MLLVQTSVKPSNIPGAGLGLFADEFISKGTRVWEFTEKFDAIISDDDVDKLNTTSKHFITTYAYRNIKHQAWVLCVDNDRFINHSETPNVIDLVSDMQDGYSIASRDIQTGEELTCDYREFDANFMDKLKSEPKR